MSDENAPPSYTHPLRLAELANKKPTRLVLEPDEAQQAAIAAELGLTGLRKTRFAVELRPVEERDWALRGKLGATVVQPCIVTLAPVTTRIDEEVSRQYLHDFDADLAPGEVEMPEDDTAEPLPEILDLGAVMIEALALALPLYPRAEGADIAQSAFTEPGKTPLSDADAKPFAGLAALRDKLGK